MIEVKTEVTEEKAPVGSVEGKPGVTVIDQSNFKDYVNEKLGDVPRETDDENIDPEVEAKEAKLETEKKLPKEGDIEGKRVFFKGKWVEKHDFSYRLHLKTEETRKEADTKIAAAEARNKALTEEKEAAERREAELKAKYEPPKGELGPEPNPEQFSDVKEYAKAIKDWVADKAIREHTEKQSKEFQESERARAVKAWEDRQAQAKIEIPDYVEKIQASGVKVSDQMRDAIVESDVGPKILYYLAEHPEIAESMGKMTIGRMLREFGKLEAIVGGQAKPVAKSEISSKAEIEVSQAPTPVTPLRGMAAPIGVLHGHDEVPKNMSYEQWKKKWQKGEIK